MRDNEFTKILNWPGYRVFRHEADETAMTLRLWVRRKRGNRKLICSGCGRKFTEAHDYLPARCAQRSPTALNNGPRMRGHAEPLEELDRSTAVATVGALSKPGENVA